MRTKKTKLFILLSILVLILVSCNGDVPVSSSSKTHGNSHSHRNEEETDSYGYTLERNQAGKVYCPDKDYVVVVNKASARDFVILNLTDIQSSNSTDVNNAKKIIRALVQYKKPDLITITGDITESGFRNELIQLCDFLDNEIQIPWAPVFGNHDHQGLTISLKKQCELFESYDLCLFRTGPSLGYTNEIVRLMASVEKLGNYIIDIVEDNGSDFKVVKSLYMMNSGSMDMTQSGKERYSDGLMYDNLNSKQLQFYTESIESAQKYGKNNSVSSALFIHVPLTEYVTAFNTAFKGPGGISLEQSYDPKYWNNGYEGSFGLKIRSICCKNFDDHIFESIKDKTDLVLCGHDHTNNFVIKYQGVTLAYSMKSGTGNTYRPELLGGTYVTVTGDGSVSLEHKTVSL